MKGAKLTSARGTANYAKEHLQVVDRIMTNGPLTLTSIV
jgi:hypothetical protein